MVPTVKTWTGAPDMGGTGGVAVELIMAVMPKVVPCVPMWGSW